MAASSYVATAFLFVLVSFLWSRSTAHARYADTLGKIRKPLRMHIDSVRTRLDTFAYRGKRAMDIAALLAAELPANISESCAHNSAYLLNHLNETWALQILDAIGKPASGLLEGNVAWLGDYDECISTETTINGSVSIHGQYCLVTFPFQVPAYGGQALNLQIGACVLSGCSSSDTTALVSTVLMLLDLKNVSNFNADCHRKYRPYDAGAIVTMVVCSTFAVLITIGTVYDVSKAIIKGYRQGHCSAEPARHRPDNIDQEPIEDSEKKPLLDSETRRSSCYFPNTMKKVLLSFSVYSNGKKLLAINQNESTLGCVNGIRFLSMCWVILGHTYGYALPIEADPAEAQAFIVKRRSFQVITNASVSVDSFFILSGLLVAYLTLKHLERKNGTLQLKEWGMLYLHRYIRLTGVYAVILMIWTWLANRFYDGPLWPTIGSFDSPCESYWWTNILYLNNFLPSGDLYVNGCMGIAWFLANDMQFFVITPPLVYLFYRKCRYGVAVVILLTIGSSAAAFGISLVYDLTSRNTSHDGWNKYYIKPWCRFQTYGVGVLLGFLLNKTMHKAPLKSSFAVAAWLIAAVVCLAVIYGPYDATYGDRSTTAPAFEYAANNSLARLAWALGLSWVIYACCTKRGGWIDTLLSWKPFVPLARLTYCAYLVHPIVMTVIESASRDTVNFDDVTMTLRFLGTLVISLAFAFVMSVSVEAPILGVEKLLLHS